MCPGVNRQGLDVRGHSPVPLPLSDFHAAGVAIQSKLGGLRLGMVLGGNHANSVAILRSVLISPVVWNLPHFMLHGDGSLLSGGSRRLAHNGVQASGPS